MPRNVDLHLYQALLLLALRDKRGTIQGSWYQQALAGALLAELFLDEQIRLARDGKTVQLDPHARSPASLKDPLLRDTLQAIASAKRRRSLSAWLSKVSSFSGLKHRAAECLCDRGILREDRERVLLFFERRVYPELDHAPEQAVVDRLAEVISSRSETGFDPHTVVLLSLAHHTDLLRFSFEKAELKRRKKHIEAVIEGEQLGAVAKEIIQGIQAAIMVSTTVPVIVS